MKKPTNLADSIACQHMKCKHYSNMTEEVQSSSANRNWLQKEFQKATISTPNLKGYQ